MGSILNKTLTARFGLTLFAAMVFGIGGRATAQIFATPLSNTYLTGSVGISGALNGINVAGRFVLTDNASPQRNPLLGPPGLGFYFSPQKTLGSYVIVRIDGGANREDLVNGLVLLTPQRGWDLIWGDVGIDGQTGLGAWLLSPFPTGSSIIASWATIPKVATATKAALPPITVDLEEVFIHDVAQIKFTITNNDNVAHSVGLRFVQEASNYLGNFLDGPILLSDGRVVCGEVKLGGPTLPDSWRALPSPSNGSEFGGVLRPRGIANLSGFPPINLVDELVIGPWGSMLSDAIPQAHWDFLPGVNGSFNFCNPTTPDAVAPAVYWNPSQFGPGERKVFLTHYGINHSSIDFTPPFIIGLDGPNSLVFDPNKPQGQQLTPNPMTIKAFARNQALSNLTNVQAVISLPPGLALAAGESFKQPKQGAPPVTLGPNGETEFSWQVVPTGVTDPLSPSRQVYSVAFSANPGVQGRSVTRPIDIPALPVQPMPVGLRMASFPYTFDDPTPTVALGLNALDFDLVRWNPLTNVYESVTFIEAGKGYWLNMNSSKTISLQGSHPLPNATFELQLISGWNQIGNPFLLGVPWGQLSVINTDSSDPDYLRTLTVEEASDASHQWISPVIYRYDINDRQYHFDSDFTTVLQPFSGYWIKAYKPNITLVTPRPLGRAARITRSAGASEHVSANNWNLRIAATSGESTDSFNYIGISPGASDGFDRRDVEKPPAIQGQVSLGIVQKGVSRSSLLARDIQSGTGGRKEWSIVVNTPKANTDVTLSWPDIGNLPKSYELYITDISTGQRKAMRQTSSLRVNSGASASRSFTITAEPRARGFAFRIDNLTVRPSGSNRSAGATVSFVTSQDASVQVRVLRSTGEVIRTLVTRAAPTGANSVTWDYRDARGAALPAGAYIIEVKGTTLDGQSARVPTTHLLVR